MAVVLKPVMAMMLVALALVVAIGVRPSRALEDLKVYRGVLVLEGKIVSGDYDKVRAFLATKSNFDKIIGGVFVASPGGNIVEAIKIGRLIRALWLSTDAPSGPPSRSPKFGQSLIKPNHLVDPRTNYLCASACFLVYVSGIYRHLDGAGRLGLHRPLQSESITKKLSVDDAFNLTWQVRNLVKRYLEDMNVPDKYVDLMYSIPSNEIRWVTQNEFDADLQGFIPELRERIGAQCNRQSSKGKITATDFTAEPPQRNAISMLEHNAIMSASADQSRKITTCWLQAKTKLSDQAWRKEFTGK